jgi:nitrate/TMAO reductase-like tetraheme cytochrome c subunit
MLERWLLRLFVSFSMGVGASLPCYAQIPGVCSPPLSAEQGEPYRSWETKLAIPISSGPSTSMTPTDAPNRHASAWAPHSLPVSTASKPTFSLASDSNDDPLASMGPDAEAEKQREARKSDAASESNLKQNGVDPHAEVFANSMYPSALQCAKCHLKIYDEWRVSGHAYATVSPMFQRFEQTINELARGTVGTFCLRCHAPVATQMNVPRYETLLEGPHVLREGITCVACHRVVERYGRVNGERRIEPGSLYDPVVGTLGGEGVRSVLADAEKWKVTTDPNDKRPRQAMHRDTIQFEQLKDSSFCAGCHQVLVQPGIALEVVYQQYRSGPAHAKGISCQDCHMGKEPGMPLGYETAPCAVISEKPVRPDQKHSNHMFHGPGYPIAHPGLFPHNEKSLRWSARQWLEFDWRAGWGTDAFEKAISRDKSSMNFPEAWKSAEERRDARKVIDANQKLLAVKRHSSQQVLDNGSRVEGPFFQKPPMAGKDLDFHFVVCNTSEGHNMPSGSLGAQPQLWLNAVLIGPDGRRVWESGDLDQNGDLRDLHSAEVVSRRIPADNQLFNLQTKFLITNLKGTEREMYLPFNVDIDPLPYLRPGAVPYSVLNHPPFVRMEAHSIPPVDSLKARYTVPGNCVQQPGRYRLSVRLRSRVEPAYFMRFVGGTPDMLRSMNEGIFDVHPYSTEFLVP